MNIIPHPSPNFNDRKRPLKYVMIHYTDMTSVEGALARMSDPDGQPPVSAHYCIARDGRIFQLVDDAQRAWHAGNGNWQGEVDMNSASIGIELDNPGHSNGYHAFPDVQIDALIGLLNELVIRHGIHPNDIIGHSDYAPARKQDPGHLFPWDQLARLGLGLWPEKKVIGVQLGDDAARAALQKLGYDLADYAAALTAFQRHFCPAELGRGLGPQTTAILAGFQG